MPSSEKSHPAKRPGMTEETAEFIAKKQHEAVPKGETHVSPVRDERKEVRREHTNGSTPRSDQ